MVANAVRSLDQRNHFSQKLGTMQRQYFLESDVCGCATVLMQTTF
ncbi:hypothetical protein [Gloeocapsa sp. PCC 7428]|nr:hypothetical protein [Gloeocapsa sp. PCC 7428]